MKLKFITVHCSANKIGRYLTARELRNYHVNVLKWSDIGYHFVIRTDGTIDEGRPLTRVGAHVAGHNTGNIGVCLIGGLDGNGRPAFTYDEFQMMALKGLIKRLIKDHAIDPNNILGHRDWFGDTNKDGVVDSRDWLKECPCFDVREWLTKEGLLKE